MDNNLKHLELIEAYLEGNLSEEEKVDFEVRLLVDKDLEEEVELYKKIVGGFQDIRSENIRKKLQAIDDDIDSNNHKPSTKFYWWAGLAACLIFVQIYLNNSRPNIPLPPEEGLPVLMGENDNIAFQNSMQLFKSGNYKLSIANFNKQLLIKPSNDTLLFYLGYSEIMEKEYNKASQHLNKLSDNKLSVFYLKALYYLAYSNYKNNCPENALKILQQLKSESNNPFPSETNLFLKVLNEN